jgi:hypothetical protein
MTMTIRERLGDKALFVMLIAGVALLAWLGSPTSAADRIFYAEVSATSTVSTTTLPVYAKSVTIANNTTSANSIRFDLYNDGETPADATTSSKELKPGESIEFKFDSTSSEVAPGASYYRTLSIICAATETATVRVYAK